MNTAHLSAFYWTVMLRSETAAAKRLNLTQPAIALQLKELQKQLKVRLFEREPFRLTVAGERALPSLTRVWEAQQEAKAALDPDGGGPVRFRLGVIESVLHSSLSTLVAELRASEPKLALEMAVHTSLDLEKLMKQGTLDLAITASPASGKQIHTCPATAMEMVFVGNRQVHTKPRYAMDELATLGLVGFQPESQPHTHLTELLRAHSRDAVVHTVSSISGMIALVSAGFGVATLPRLVAERLAEREPNLRLLPCQQALDPLPIHISYRIDPGEPRHAALIQRVIAFLQRKRAAKPR